jgi:CRP-like cAMP-binding protein
MSSSDRCSRCAGAAGGLLSCLTPEQRTRLAAAAVSHAYLPRESIFHEGTPALAVYCVRSGTIKLFRRLDQGTEVVVATRGPGDLTGLRGVLGDIPYGASATALEPATVCTIPGEIFMSLVRENATLGCRLLVTMARESRLAEAQFVARMHSRVRQRLARFLADRMAEGSPAAPSGNAVAIPMSREELAQLVGTTPETLSRALHGFAEDGVLALDRREVRVLDRAALLKRAE